MLGHRYPSPWIMAQPGSLSQGRRHWRRHERDSGTRGLQWHLNPRGLLAPSLKACRVPLGRLRMRLSTHDLNRK